MRFGLITMEPGAQFRYRLHGYTLGWSTWRTDRVLTLRAPEGGDYSIEVQARTQSGREASPLYYRFTVEPARSEEHTSELQSLMRMSYAVFCLKTKNRTTQVHL